MIKNYFLIAIRSFWKNRATSIIKIAGLAMGLSVVLLIHIYTSFQYSYDNYHKKGDRIYRVAYHLSKLDFGEWDAAKTGHNLGAMLQNNFPEIESTTRITWFEEVTILHQNQKFKESKFMFADSSALKMFSFPMKKGDAENALNERKSIVISSKIAKKYFGNENPVGKYLDDNLQLKITGVMDVPDNSHFRFDILASYSTIYDVLPWYKKVENSDHTNVYTYLLLRKGANAKDLEKKFPKFEQTLLKKNSFYNSAALFLEPLKEIQINSKSEAYLGEFNLTKFTLPIIYLFSILGLIIIGIACFNFINISIAHIAERTREVGVRKVFGAKRIEIFFQFVCEYWLISLIAVLISMLIVQIFLPLISSEINRHIEINYFKYAVASLSIMLLVTILAGVYPSLIVANVNPVNALQNGFKGPKGNILRSTLIVTQFTVSIILLLITIFISNQIKHYADTDAVGFNPKDLLVIKMDYPKIKENYELLKSELLRNPDVLSVSASSNIPAVTGASLLNIKVDQSEEMSFAYISIDAEFTKNLGIKTLEGRSFKPEFQNDIRTTYLLSKTASKQLGIGNSVGRNITIFKDQNGKSVPDFSGQIIGTVDDYSYRPAYDKSKGVVFTNDPNLFQAMFIHISPSKQKETLNMVKKTWEKLFSNIPLSVDFLEDEIKNDFGIQIFLSVQRFIIAAAVFSFFIALLGLFGLSIFSARQRVKEIGIRRANGASLIDLLMLMNRKFIIMVLISVIISFPIVYVVLSVVEEKAPNSTNLSVLNYAILFLILMTLSILTVSWQSMNAATRNPVEALRYE
jgi:putative ABC transport system permease protein